MFHLLLYLLLFPLRKESVSTSLFQFLFGGRLVKGLNYCLVYPLHWEHPFRFLPRLAATNLEILLSLFCQSLTLQTLFL